VSWLAIPFLNNPTLQLASDIALMISLVAGVAGIVVRYRRGTEKLRRQLLWLLLAATISVAVAGSMRLLGPVESTGFPIILLTVIALIPVSMMIAVLRYQLLDIRLVWARTVTYAVLTAAVVATYLGLVELVDRLLRPRISVSAAVLATLVGALFNPVRVRLQGFVDNLLYGDRADPVRAASSVAAQLAGASEPADVLPAVCHALRLPYAALTDEAGVIRGEHGARPAMLETIPLLHAGERAGELQVGIRPGEVRLAAADRVVLELMAAPIGVALRAQALSDAVQRSRREIVAAREEERRRLRRDLHDGLGPALTGIGFRADAVVNLAGADRLVALGTDIRSAVDGAMTDVRRLINQLQPSALDDVGLVEAVRRHAALLDRRMDGSALRVSVAADVVPADLPAAVEVTAYRIVTEALTNVVRHSLAGRVEVRIAVLDAALELTVADDGRAVNGRWVPGVGLTSMRERVAELGGTMVAEPTPAGGRVHLCLPLGGER
jgi:signal transduction histidine kinase